MAKRWKQSIYIPLPKKVDARGCSNNRANALMSHTSEIFMKIIQHRIEDFSK